MFKSTESAAELFQDEEHQNRVATFENKLHQEFVDEQFKPQLQRDADLWYQTLENPGDARVGSILQRICIILRYGGLMYRKDKKSKTWNSWADTKWSIATALSHGGRIVIQLPCGFAIPAATAAKKKTGFLQNVLNKIFDGAMTSTSTNEESHDHAFWYWLITGDPNSKQFESNYVSLMTSGDECEKENKVIFKRLGATHALTYDKSNINKNDFKDEEDDDVEEATDYLEALPYKRYKYIKEIKVKLGVNARDTKVLRSKQVQYQKHRHWGMNIAMGGDGNKSHGFNPKAIVERNGSYGHMYLYYMSGVEGSEYGKMDHIGHFHTISAKSSVIGVTNGYKWRGKKHSLEGLNGPDKYDSMFVDLSKTGWIYLLSQKWDNSMVKETAEVPCDADKMLDL